MSSTNIDRAIMLYNLLVEDGIITKDAYDLVEEHTSGSISFRKDKGSSPEIRYSNNRLFLVLDDNPDVLIDLDNIAKKSLKMFRDLEEKNKKQYPNKTPWSTEIGNNYRNRRHVIENKKSDMGNKVVGAVTIFDENLPEKPGLVLYTNGGKRGDYLRTHLVEYDRSIPIRR